MNAPSTATSLVQGDPALSDAERAIEIENGHRDVRANVFLVAMVGIGACTVLTGVLLCGSGPHAEPTPGTGGSVTVAR